MRILEAFFPFLAFALVDRALGPTDGLIAGAIVAIVMLIREMLVLKQSAKLLDIGTTILFGGLALYALIVQPRWSVIGVRLCVDAGLLLIVLASLALKRPFTEQYAREQVSREYWDTPDFKRVNMVISAAWALAFAVMVCVEIALLTVPDLPLRLGVWTIVGALVFGVWFSGWYPERARLASKSVHS